MPQAQCVKYRIRPDHREKLAKWITLLKNRSKEVIAALAEGGFIAEAVFLEKLDSGEHILIYTSAQDL